MTQMTTFWRNPLAREFDRFFDDLGLLRRGESDLTKYGFSPHCEVTEDKSNYLLKFDLPGIPKEEIKVDLHDNRLTVSGERKEEKHDDTKRKHFSEVFYGSFSRSIEFPTSVNAELVSASYDNGILSVTVPKTDGVKARQISIK